MSINKVILVGNVGKDPEVRYLESGVALARFPFATSETYKGKDGEKVTTTEWHNIVLWRGLAEVAEKYVKKGSQLYLEGKIKTRSYDDKDGVKRYMTEIVTDQMQMLGRRQDSGEESQRDNYGNQGSGSNQQTPEKRASQEKPAGNSESSSDFETFDNSPDTPDDLPF